MIICSYCGGVTEQRRTCQNCAAPVIVEAQATLYDSHYSRSNIPGRTIRVPADTRSELSDLMQQVSMAGSGLIGILSK